jgi:large subunit ribosomal protein L16
VLQPKRVKYRKLHRGNRRGKAHAGNDIIFGEFGLQAQEAAWITSRQIESARRVMVRYLRRGGKMWIRIFPDKSVTKKPAETRMGSGKGAPEGWVAVVKPGRMLFEIAGIKESMAKEAMKLASYKLPIGTRFMVKGGGEG